MLWGCRAGGVALGVLSLQGGAGYPTLALWQQLGPARCGAAPRCHTRRYQRLLSSQPCAAGYCFGLPW